ncbi:MAG: PTS sugar transporter subunit IIA [Desulfosalsimonadaceae bacterium]|nr:PTS sugar transporter subunit IIA [Desulfosalsimonadaceae bacterium]
MELELEKLAVSLNLPPATVERWIRQGRLPVRQKGSQCIFSQSSLKKWAETNHLTFAPKGPEISGTPEIPADTLSGAMERGGIFYDVEGHSIETVLQSVVDRVGFLQSSEQKHSLYESLLAREQLMSTGIGRGVAIPHPRTPLGEIEGISRISVCFLKAPVDYKALDRQPVFVLFVLVCPSAKTHLRLLARLSYCLREESFVDFLRHQPEHHAFYEKIRDVDSRFDAPVASS